MAERARPPRVRLDPWPESDIDLLFAMNDPEMTAHLGGPETDDKVRARHRRYVDMDPAGPDRMFSIVLLPDEVAVGGIGHWKREWRDETVYETGWHVLPSYQGRGIAAAAAVATIALARDDGRYRYMHAFPSVDNPASNAICRKAGFVLLGESDFEYPPGRPMRCNDWQFDLAAPT